MKARLRALALLLLALAGAGATAALGLWQLDRAAGKLTLQAEQDALAQLPPEVLRDIGAAPAPGRRAEARGQWLADRTVFLDNRAMDGRAGFFVLTPLRLPSGAVLLVQRGWAPRHAALHDRLPPVDTPAGEVQVSGRVVPEPSRAYELGAAASGPIRQNLDLAALAADLRAPLLPFTLLQTEADAPVDGLLRHWPAPDSGVQKHYGYAFQWFALCGLILGLYVWFQVLRPRLRRA